MLRRDVGGKTTCFPLCLAVWLIESDDETEIRKKKCPPKLSGLVQSGRYYFTKWNVCQKTPMKYIISQRRQTTREFSTAAIKKVTKSKECAHRRDKEMSYYSTCTSFAMACYTAIFLAMKSIPW